MTIVLGVLFPFTIIVFFSTCFVFSGLAALEGLVGGGVFYPFEQLVPECFVFNQVVSESLGLD